MASVIDTSPENTLSSFDLDLLIGSASSSIFQNSENINNGYQIHSMENTSTADLGYQAHNVENLKTTDYQQCGSQQNQVQNFENQLYKPEHVDHDVVKKSDYEALQKDYKVKCDDYEAVKKQYARIASDYANLHDENKKHALEALNVSARNEQLEKQVTSYTNQIKSLREQIEKMYTHNFAQNNSMTQFQSFVAELQAQNAILVNDLKSEKQNGKDARKMISTLNNSNQTLTEHLCLFGCIIEERRPIEKETRRLVKKYCKKCITSNKKNVEVENFSNHSFDTGRGSSLSCSDGERSFYSPAFSLNFSPLSTGTLITKASMTDAASSPPPVTKTLDISTSPIIFEEVITTPSDKTSDAATSPTPRYEAGTPEVKAKLLHVATSPVKFSDSITRNTIDFASSPIMFDDSGIPVFKTTFSDIATSPVKFANTSLPVVKRESFDIATSPVKFADKSIPVVKTNSLDVATSPVKFADTSIPVVKTKLLDIATSPVKFADTNPPVVKSRSLGISTSPVQFSDTSTQVPKDRTIDTGTSPLKFADTRTPVVKMKSLDIATSPVKFADANTPVVKSRSLGITTTSVKFADTNTQVPKEKPIDTVTSPVKFASTGTPEAKTLMETSPTQVSGKIHPEDNKKTLIMTRLENTKKARARKYKLDVTLSNPCADSSTSVPKATTENLSVSNVQPDTDTVESNTCHMNEITQKLNEIESLHLDQEDSENDLEIKMILRKQNLDWDMLSPMSLTPELDPENEQKQKSEENDKVKEQCLNMKPTENRNLIQSLHVSGDEDSDAEIDREDNNVDSLVIERPQHLGNNEDNLVKNLKMKEILNSRIEEVKLPVEILNKKLTKTKKTTKYKKLTNLQKIYKANIPKSKIKSQLPLDTNHGMKLYSLSPKKYSASLIPNKEVQKLPEQNASQKQNINCEVSKETVKCTFKKPQPLPEFCPKKSTEPPTNSECAPLTQTNLQHETVPKKGECMSTEKQITSNSMHHTKPNLLLESVLKTREFMSTDCKSNNVSNLPHMQTDLQPQTVCMPTETQAKSISDLKTQTYVSPESGRRKTLCTPNPQSNCKNETNRQTTIGSESSPSVQNKPTELINEYELSQCYQKPSSKRISRVGKSISTNSPVPPNQVEDNTNLKRIFASDTINDNSHDLCGPSYKKDKANHDMVVSPVLEDEQTKRICSTEEDREKSTNNNEIALVSNKDENQKTDNISTVTSDTLRPDEINICSISKTKSAPSARQFADYNDMSLFTNTDEIISEEPKNNVNDNKTQERGCNLLDKMLYKYGSNSKPQKRPIYDAVVAEKIETGVNKCVEIIQKPDEYEKTVHEIVKELKRQGSKKITFGFMMYLNNPARKAQFVPERKAPGHRQRNAMTVTKPVMVLIDIIETLEQSGIDLWDVILDSCEYTLFSLEKGATPVFDVIESVAHLFANICKYRGNVSRLWMFMLNAMYCLSFKAIPVIKHCLDVVPRVLPLSHTNIDPVYTPMIRCLVFLIHYYNCNDPFKRVQELRERLKDKYFYNLQDENETTILFLLKNSITNLSESKLESGILELSFLIMAKRRGTKWCHKNIVQKILLPMIKGEIDVSYRGKRFCITMIGQIMKPYKNEMIVHSEEVVNLLTSMFDQSQPHEIKEDIVCSLINMNMKTISERINKCLFNWNPPHLSPEFEEALKDYIQSKNISTWRVEYQKMYKER